MHEAPSALLHTVYLSFTCTNRVLCQMSIASSCSATKVEVEQSAEPLAALDRRIAVGRSHRLLAQHEQPVAQALVVALAARWPRSTRSTRTTSRSCSPPTGTTQSGERHGTKITFQIRARYFADRNRASVRSKVYATVIRHWGTPQEQVTEKVVALKYGKEMHDIETFVQSDAPEAIRAR